MAGQTWIWRLWSSRPAKNLDWPRLLFGPPFFQLVILSPSKIEDHFRIFDGSHLRQLFHHEIALVLRRGRSRPNIKQRIKFQLLASRDLKKTMTMASRRQSVIAWLLLLEPPLCLSISRRFDGSLFAFFLAGTSSGRLATPPLYCRLIGQRRGSGGNKTRRPPVL